MWFLDLILAFNIILQLPEKEISSDEVISCNVFNLNSTEQRLKFGLTSYEPYSSPGRAWTNVVTFECSFIFVIFVSRSFATKLSFILIMHKLYVKVSLMHKQLRSLLSNIASGVSRLQKLGGPIVSHGQTFLTRTKTMHQ